MKRILFAILALAICSNCYAQGSAIPPYVTQYWRSVVGLDNPVHQPLSTDSTSFFQILDAAGTGYAGVFDTTNKRLGIGTAVPTTTRSVKKFIEIEDGTSAGLLLHDTGQASEWLMWAVSDGVRFSYGTHDIFWLKNNDSVGVNVSPERPMHTRGQFNAFRMDRGNNTVPFIILAGYTTTGYGTVAQVWGFGGAGTQDFQITDMAASVSGVGTSRVTIKQTTGYFGIAETAPETLLELTHATPYFTLHNSTHEDSDGGRESRLNFKGEQSGEEETTLARIEVSHDGAADDEKGKIVFSTNDGSDADAPTAVVTINSSGIVQMEDDKLIAVDTNAGLTASTTQTQGQGALTAQVNEISTVANKDDTVTLPTAVTGVMIEIINNGANTLQIFPASGDDLGLGVNVGEELEANESVGFVAYTTTNWAKEFTTEIIHAEIHDEDNTDAFVVNDAGGDFHSYHTNGLVAGDLADWAFDAGGAGTSFPIASVANSAGSPGTQILVTTTGAHGLAVGDIISQTNLADAAYVGVFEVVATAAATTYEVTAAYTATGTGTMDQAATLTADAVAAGVYSFAYYITGTLVGNNETFDFQLYREATAVTGSKIRRKFAAANDFGSMSGGGVVAVANGDKISLALSNEDSAANIILRNVTIVLIRL